MKIDSYKRNGSFDVDAGVKLNRNQKATKRNNPHYGRLRVTAWGRRVLYLEWRRDATL